MDARKLFEIKATIKVPDLKPGDTVNVKSQVKEGDRTRSQSFQGVVVREGGSGPSRSFTVRRIAHGVGVERTYLVHSPLLESVELLRKGSVRRAKLGYLRGLSARDARIKEKGRLAAEEAAEAAPAAEKPVAPAEAKS
ncbi:MAG: 50S ribosomal protein L19 [Chloroflexi bacterium]|nr:50S ribosomal protein L19 [Chloroflexota bacterium]